LASCALAAAPTVAYKYKRTAGGNAIGLSGLIIATAICCIIFSDDLRPLAPPHRGVLGAYIILYCVRHVLRERLSNRGGWRVGTDWQSAVIFNIVSTWSECCGTPKSRHDGFDSSSSTSGGPARGTIAAWNTRHQSSVLLVCSHSVREPFGRI